METAFQSNPFLNKNCVWHPFTQMQTAEAPIPILRAQGAYLYAEDGRRFLDAISSWWVNLHGHSHPYIADRIRAQAAELEHVIFAGFTHRPAVELASRLLELLPGSMSKLFYSDNGSTAVEVAIKMALQYRYNQHKAGEKSQLICFKQSYHGDTFGAMSAAGKNAFNRPFWSHLFDVHQIDPPLKGNEEATLEQLKCILQRKDSACFIFEPLILGSGGMIIYSAEALDAMIALCRQYGVLTIADEVMTGFGRTGTLFACQQLKEPVDIMCLSKGLTGGFLPLGATACQEHVFNAFLGDTLQTAFLHGHSYTGNPIACSSALASLDLLLQPDCFKQREMISQCHSAFCSEWGSHPKLRRCEVLGTILALEYKVESVMGGTYFQPLRDKLYSYFLGKGILLRPLGNVLYLMPPYCIEEAELQEIYAHIILTLEGAV